MSETFRQDGHLRYRPEIDGLRAIAVLSVILYHAGFSWFGGGFVGVDVFFVISGYLITGILVGENEVGNFSILRFYERRARRILPCLFLVLFITICFAPFAMLPSQMLDLGKSLASVIIFISNFYLWKTTGYFDSASESKPLLHTWSLGVEEQFYIFFPIFLSLVWKLEKKIHFDSADYCVLPLSRLRGMAIQNKA